MFLPGIVLPAQPLLTGQVTEKTGGAPIPYANVVVIGSGQGAACDSLGIFELALPPGKYQLEFSALGYRSKKLAVLVKEGESKTLRVALQTAVLELSDEVVVYGENEFNKTDDRLNSTDDIIRQVEGVSMLRRANFALEPSIRGMSAGQVGIVVDGMKIFSACVDRMDPVTAYVEVENLEKLEVSKGAFDMTRAPSLGGAINMVTHKPDFNRPFAIQAETGFESVSQLRLFRGVVNYANHSLAARGISTPGKKRRWRIPATARTIINWTSPKNSGAANNWNFPLSVITPATSATPPCTWMPGRPNRKFTGWSTNGTSLSGEFNRSTAKFTITASTIGWMITSGM